MRQLTINCKDGKFRVRGTGRWADFGEAWLCTHDILHHHPGDKGTVEEELMTFGAEMWFDAHSNSEKFPVNHTALSGVLLDSYSGRGVPTKFFVRPAPPMAQQLPEELVYGMHDFAGLGLGVLAHDLLRQHPASFLQRNKALTDKLRGHENIARYGGWITHGYLQARTRWPNSLAAQGLFDELHEYLQRVGYFEGVLKLEIDEPSCNFRALNRDAAQFVQELVLEEDAKL